MKKVMVYKRFERFWHWLQALLIILLALTGFDIHYPQITIFDFATAHMIHKFCAWAFIVLVAFAIFWHFTTGEWRQYIPTKQYVGDMVQFYLVGIFKNAPHPVKKTLLSKLNPLQRLVYLGLKILIIPVMVTTGLMLIFYNELLAAGYGISLGLLATIHTIGALALMVFLAGHIYLITTGHTPASNLKAMITGYEELEEDDELPTAETV
ncbi:MAG: cytochrome b/b6 domain-containing protein [Phycisphaeraceae bacterium JB051]